VIINHFELPPRLISRAGESAARLGWTDAPRNSLENESMKKRKSSSISRPTATVLPFPKPKRGRKRRKAEPGAVVAFPLIKQAAAVRSIVAEMRRTGSLDAAEAALVRHLEVECSRLERIGISDAEIEHVCRSLAGLTWMLTLRSDDDGWSGGAA
jgi:hypothetical protein